MFWTLRAGNAVPMGEGSDDGGRLFLATLPDAGTAAQIHQRATNLRRAHGFDGHPIAPQRLHVSLFFLGGLPSQAIPKVCDAIAGIRAPPFVVVFDRSVSFRGKPGSRPFVLIGDEGPTPLKWFRERLGAALAGIGFGRLARRGFTPHVTLLYDARSAEEHPVAPVTWQVSEFVLVHSHNGHRHLARWRLRG